MKFDRADIELLEEIVQVNHAIFEGMYRSEPYSLDQYRERLARVEPLIYVARCDDKIVGDAISFGKDDSLYLWILGVSENFRNQGVASGLLDLTEGYARDEGFRSVTTKVHNVSKDMLRLVLERGYTLIDVEKSEADPRHNAVHFKLGLASARS
ncbi:MAG: GNAT family N-acetyltransferase [Nanoarchaeota archaeon]|nr:GNAT family N-acetyltransferase [Nanoarchaeota archaeon]